MCKHKGVGGIEVNPSHVFYELCTIDAPTKMLA